MFGQYTHMDGAYRAREREMFAAGQIVRDSVTGDSLVVVEDRGNRVLVAGLSSLKLDATLIERAQRVLPAADLVAA